MLQEIRILQPGIIACRGGPQKPAANRTLQEPIKLTNMEDNLFARHREAFGALLEDLQKCMDEEKATQHNSLKELAKELNQADSPHGNWRFNGRWKLLMDVFHAKTDDAIGLEAWFEVSMQPYNPCGSLGFRIATWNPKAWERYGKPLQEMFPGSRIQRVKDKFVMIPVECPASGHENIVRLLQEAHEKLKTVVENS